MANRREQKPVTLQPKDISEDEHKDSETIRQVHQLFSNILI